MHRINIKPLSVNEAWKGRRIKTPKYKAFEQELLLRLPRKVDIPDGPLCITFVFGFSSAASDYDNAIKQAQDVIAKKYGFDDKRITHAIIHKTKTSKGAEYLSFGITPASLFLEV